MNRIARLINVDNDLNYAVNEAVKLYNNGEIFVYPTDTVYGFGSNPFNQNAIKKIIKIKNRQESKQFILLIDSLNTLLDYIIKPQKSYEELLSKIWPNPVSIILELNEDKKRAFNSETAAFRIPDHKFCISLLQEIKLPLVSTSVNINNELPLMDYSTIFYKFSKDVSAVFYTNNEENKEPSTLINLCGEKPVILRQGSTKFAGLIQKYL